MLLAQTYHQQSLFTRHKAHKQFLRSMNPNAFQTTSGSTFQQNPAFSTSQVSNSSSTTSFVNAASAPRNSSVPSNSLQSVPQAKMQTMPSLPIPQFANLMGVSQQFPLYSNQGMSSQMLNSSQFPVNMPFAIPMMSNNFYQQQPLSGHRMPNPFLPQASVSVSVPATTLASRPEDDVRRPRPKHSCPVPACGRSYTTEQSLLAHLQQHDPRRPFLCTICHRSFKERPALTRHIRIHTGEKPYKCRIEGCDRAFADISNAKRHQRSHKGLKPFKCHLPGCTKEFSRRFSLRSHLIRVHKLNEDNMWDDVDQVSEASDSTSTPTPTSPTATPSVVPETKSEPSSD